MDFFFAPTRFWACLKRKSAQLGFTTCCSVVKLHGNVWVTSQKFHDQSPKAKTPQTSRGKCLKHVRVLCVCVVCVCCVCVVCVVCCVCCVLCVCVCVRLTLTCTLSLAHSLTCFLLFSLCRSCPFIRKLVLAFSCSISALDLFVPPLFFLLLSNTSKVITMAEEFVEDETFAERFEALKEMFPEPVRNLAASAFSTSQWAASNTFTYGGKLLWVVASSAVILGLIPQFEADQVCSSSLLFSLWRVFQRKTERHGERAGDRERWREMERERGNYPPFSLSKRLL